MRFNRLGEAVFILWDRGSGNTQLHTRRIIRLAKGRRSDSPTYRFAGFCFHGLGCGEFPVSVWLRARGTRMQFTNFADRSTTSSARHGQCLFQGEVFALHHHIIERGQPRKCPILLISATLKIRSRLCSRCAPAFFCLCEQK